MPITTHTYSLSIKNACQQQWSAMAEQQGGKYCTQCAKSVIDFTGLSDQEIIQLLSRNTGNVCARVSPEQLNRNLLTNTPKPKRTGLAIFTGLFAMLTLENANAALRKPIINTWLYHIDDKGSRTDTKSVINTGSLFIDSQQNIIRGKVTGEYTKLPLAYATVMIKNTNKGVLTDTLGQFTIVVPENLKAKQIELVVSAVGYTQAEKKIDISHNIMDQSFMLVLNEELLGEVIIVRKRKKWWQFWK